MLFIRLLLWISNQTSPQRRSKSTTVPNLTLHRAHTMSDYQLPRNNLYRTKSMNVPTTNFAPIAFMESHPVELRWLVFHIEEQQRQKEYTIRSLNIIC